VLAGIRQRPSCQQRLEAACTQFNQYPPDVDYHVITLLDMFCAPFESCTFYRNVTVKLDHFGGNAVAAVAYFVACSHFHAERQLPVVKMIFDYGELG
jgi:hypothetical protein